MDGGKQTHTAEFSADAIRNELQIALKDWQQQQKVRDAAPDLLAMLKVAQLWLDVDGRYDMQGINAAIAKATQP